MTGVVLLLVAFAAVSGAAATPIATSWSPACCRKGASGGIACLDAPTSFTDYDFDYLYNLIYPGGGFERFGCGASFDDIVLGMIEGYPRLGYCDLVSRNVAFSKGGPQEFAQYLPLARGFGYDACKRSSAFSDCDSSLSAYYPKEIRYCNRGSCQGYADCCECGGCDCGGCCCCCCGVGGRLKNLNGDCFASGFYGGRIPCPC